MKKLNEIIKSQRTLKNLTQAELADFADVNINTVVKIEKDENKTSVETLRKVLDVLGLDLLIVPKVDAKSKFLDEYYPHLKDTDIRQYLLRIIAEIEKYKGVLGTSKKEDIISMDFEKLISKLYEPKLKTHEGQSDFYLALKILPSVTEKMSESHILFWSVGKVDIEGQTIIFDCKKLSTVNEFGLEPLPYCSSMERTSICENVDVQNFMNELSSMGEITLKDILHMSDKDAARTRLLEFLRSKSLDENICQLMVNKLL